MKDESIMKKENIIRLINTSIRGLYYFRIDDEIREFIINNINEKDENNMTFLMWAAHTFNFDLAKKLIYWGADKSLKSEDKISALRVLVDFHGSKLNESEEKKEEFMKFFDLLEN